MECIEYKKINYIFSVYDIDKESIEKLSFNEKSLTYINNLISNFNINIRLKMKFKRTKIHEVLPSLEEDIQIIEEYYKTLPVGLMILRNQLKNCTYCKDISDLEFKLNKIYKEIDKLVYAK